MKISNAVQELIDEVRSEYPNYTDEHVSEYVAMMRDEGFSDREICQFVVALGY